MTITCGSTPAVAPPRRALGEREISDWVRAYLAAVVGLDREAIDASTSLASIGLDSVEAVVLLSDLELWLGRALDAPSLARFSTLGELVTYLANDRQAPRAVEDTAGEDARHAFERWVNPALGRRLRSLRMDKRFVRGEGSWLYDAEGRAYLDFIAAYGALPFGHAPEAIWRAIRAVDQRREPVFTQPSAADATGELARRLLDLAGPEFYQVTFANSGAEAVEAALKLARAATGRLGIVSAVNGFHGKTLGALSATGKPAYQEGFGAPVPHFYSVPYGDVEALERFVAANGPRLAAFLIEPLLGEGGMVVPPEGYLLAAKEICERAGMLFIADEIQTGLGRTGSLFACANDGVVPDVLLLAKALGGGVCPIAAVIAGRAAYTERFGLRHSSTFAGNALACRAALAALDELAQGEHALLRAVSENGAFLREGLLALQRRFPNVVSEVRGRGFMLGLRLRPDADAQASFLGVAASQGHYAAIVSSYLLNVHGLRLAPTLNGSDVLRIEPPLTASRAECEHALGCIERALTVLASNDSAAVLKGILYREPGVVSARAPASRGGELRAAGGATARFAFVVHPLELASFRDFDPALGGLGEAELAEVGAAAAELLEPFVIAEARVRSRSGGAVVGEFIVVPRTASALRSLSEADAVAEVARAVLLARSRGAELVGLGGYTSVVTRGGRAVADLGVPITTGNAYTAVSGIESLRLALEHHGRTLGTAAAAVVGAAGAVGHGAALLLALEVPRLLLVGNPARSQG
jgi:acetylornithine/succinyldiaminopimelate/putrescine aminotransferase/acyl carrier protein